MSTILPMRSLLFAPGNRPDVVAKLPRSNPDAVVVDLEDAVAPSAKAASRAVVYQSTTELVADPNGPAVWVRVNALRSEYFADDIAESLHAGLAGVVVPKIETPDDIAAVHAALGAAGLGALPILAGLETVRGVANSREVLATGVAACYFGAEDFIADIGGARRPDNLEVLYARSQVMMAARLGGVHALDQIVADYQDDTAFVEDGFLGRSIGYGGKLCIHPQQVQLAHSVFTPSEAEVERARALLAAYEEANAQGIAAIAVDGQMVDEPLAKHARSLVAAWEATQR